MSKGTPVYPVRIEPELHEAIMNAIRSANRHRRYEPYSFSGWIRAAIQEKLDHRTRSKKGKKNVESETRNGELAQSPEAEGAIQRP
jgi:hypothetical protein